MKQRSREECIDDAIEAWHNAPENDIALHEWLGWTWKEYKIYTRFGIPPMVRHDII